MEKKREKISSGVRHLDRILDRLHIGDNVIWYDDAGSLAPEFCLKFLESSQLENKPTIYVSFDRSPKNLLDRLGKLSKNRLLTVLDCFTYGKGSGSEVFLEFYSKNIKRHGCSIITVNNPRNSDVVIDAFYSIHENYKGDVRFIFESLTGMEQLWGEEALVQFYSHACPRLYELNTIAYWVMEKNAHSSRTRARINQTAQIAIDLSVRRGITSLTILKAENRDLNILDKPLQYWSRDSEICFEDEGQNLGHVSMGPRIKALRTKRGIPQKKLAKLVGVTPSTISQVETGLIYPSIPALLKMAEVLSVDMSSFFREKKSETRTVFRADEALGVRLHDLPDASIDAKLLTPADFDAKAELFLMEIPANRTLTSHFFISKKEEFGYLISGELNVNIGNSIHTLRPGDSIYLATDIPSQWKNPGQDTALLLWVKLR